MKRDHAASGGESAHNVGKDHFEQAIGALVLQEGAGDEQPQAQAIKAGRFTVSKSL